MWLCGTAATAASPQSLWHSGYSSQSTATVALRYSSQSTVTVALRYSSQSTVTPSHCQHKQLFHNEPLFVVSSETQIAAQLNATGLLKQHGSVECCHDRTAVC
jgi:hypothetical protein